MGVTFFFALSGFVLVWTARARPVRAWRFYRRRFARVYPLYLVTALLSGAAFIAAGRSVTLREWLTNLPLLQAWAPSAEIHYGLTGVGWSLSCEAFFYLLTPLLLAWAARQSTKLCVTVAGVMLSLSTIVALAFAAFIPDENIALWVSPAFSLPVFTTGMVTAVVLMRTGRSVSVFTAFFLLVASVALVAALSMHAQLGRPLATIIVLPAMAFMLGALAARDLSGAATYLSRPFVVRLGEWSFALYLTHLAIVRAVHQWTGSAPARGWTGIALLLLVVGLAVAIAAAAFLLFERPLERVLRPKGNRTQEDG